MIKDIIINKLNFQENQFILAFDPDNLLSFEDVVDSINGLGFDVINFEDPEMFRYYYEENIRNIIDKCEKLNKKIIVRYTTNRTIPYDIQKRFWFVKFSLREIFPKLSYNVIKELYAEVFDRLYTVYRNYKGPALGDRGTKEFVLKNVYGIVPEVIMDFQDLIKTFIPFYYKGEELPKVIADYAVEMLRRNNDLKRYPIGKVVESKGIFFHFLQEQWERYVKHVSGEDINYTDANDNADTNGNISAIAKSNTKANINANTSVNTCTNSNDIYTADTAAVDAIVVEFNNYEIRAYMDNLFQENLLVPVRQLKYREYPSWMRAGVVYDMAGAAKNRFNSGIDKISGILQNIKSYKDWFVIAGIWGEISVIKHHHDNSYSLDRLDNQKYAKMRGIINDKFKAWLFDNYGKLPSLSYAKSPVMVHKIPWYISYRMNKENIGKVALIVMDGMSLDNWFVVKSMLNNNESRNNYKDKIVPREYHTVENIDKYTDIYTGMYTDIYTDVHTDIYTDIYADIYADKCDNRHIDRFDATCTCTRYIDRYVYEEYLCFAWVPTITSISRQAIFSGEIPVNFSDTLLSTNYDERHWRRFWKNIGFTDRSIAYKRGIRRFNEEGLRDIIEDDRTKVLGLVVNIIDDIMHGQQLSVEGMHHDIRLWMKKDYLQQFLKYLFSKGFDVFITSDHGNIGALGQGSLQEGLLVESPGERIRIYDTGMNYDTVLSKRKAFEWIKTGLSQKYSYILCEDSYAFITEGRKIVSHGGLALEEVIVPFIHLKNI